MFISLSPKNQNTITKAKKNSTATSTTQHQAITHSSSKHHSTITTHQGNFTKTCPRRHQHITERSPKHHQKANKTTPRHHQKRQRQDRDITETSPKPHRDITETRQRQDQDKTETRPRHDRDIIETSPRQDRDKTKTRPRHDRDMTETSPRQGSTIRRHTGHRILPQLHWFAHGRTSHQPTLHQNRSHHHHGTAEGSFTAKTWFGHRAGRSPCAHSIGKFFLCYIVLFSCETSAPGSPGNYL